jgi:uncharacterized protein YjbI with pentapeptide repeats
MASEEHLATLRRGIPAWNDWRAANPSITPNLSRVDLHGSDFAGANLEGTNLTRSRLASSKFAGARVAGANFRETDLTNADLREAVGVSEERFPGANLTAARLPDPVHLHLLQRLERVETLYGSCQQIFVTLLIAALYTWLTIAATSHARLLSDSASSPLPIVGTPIPIAQFYLVAPVVVLVLFGYLHLSMQRLWNYLGGLPAVFPDGERLDQKSYPRVLSSFIRTQCALLRPGCPRDVRVLTGILSLVVWGGGTFLVGWVWWQYLPRREWLGAGLLFALLVVSMVLGVVSYRAATSALGGVQTRVSRDGLAALIASAALLGAVFIIKLNGQLPDETSNRCIEAPRERAGLWTMLTMVRDALRCTPLANLRQADLSVRPPVWKDSDEDNGQVQGAFLRGKNLNYARAINTFLVNADLAGATLQYANLQQARLQKASLREADLTGAYLLWANLQAADFRGAILDNAVLREANLGGTKFSRFNNCDQRCFKAARLNHVILVKADLSEADLKEAILEDARLDGAKMPDAMLQGANLARASLRGAQLQRAKLSGVVVLPLGNCVDAQNACPISRDPSELPPANLLGADLIDANFSDAKLIGVNLQGADLRGVDFQKADLSGAVGLTLDQLATVKTLYEATLDPALLEQVKKTYPELRKLKPSKSAN